MSREWQIAVVLVLALIAGSVGLVIGNRTSAVADSRARLGALLSLRLPDVSGREVSLDRWRGRVIVANFWATWCPPCLEEIPAFERVSRKYTDVQFVGISIDSADNVRDFAARNAVTYPLLIASADTLGVTSKLGNPTQGLPFTVIIDHSGAARKVKLGRLSEADLDATLAGLR